MTDKRQSEYGLFWGEDVLYRTVPTTPIIKNLLWEGDNVVLLGSEKIGKSILALEIACCLTTANPFLDTYDVIEPKEVLYIQVEGKRRDTQERLEAMMKGLDCDLNLFTHLFQPGLALDKMQTVNMLKDMLERNKRHPDVVIIDPLYMAMEGDMKDAKASRAWINNVRVLFGKYNSTVIVIHHKHRPKKDSEGQYISEGDNAIFGSYVWKAFPDHIFNMKRIDKQRKTFVVTCDTQRSSKIASRIEFKLHEPVPLLFTHVEEGDTNASVVVHKVLSEKGALTTEEICQHSDVSIATAYRAIRILRNNGVVHRDRRKKPYKYFLGDIDLV